MRTYPLLLSLALLCLALSAHAQDQAPAPDTDSLRHSLGATVSPVRSEYFQAAKPMAFGLVYRRQLSPARALRAAVTAAYESRDHTNKHPDSLPKDSAITSSLVALAVGHEWQLRLGRWLAVGYGADASFQLLRHRIEVDNILIGDVNLISEQYISKFNTTGVYLQPFLNLGLNLSPRVVLVAETKASWGYNRKTFKGNGTRGDVNARPEERGRLFADNVRQAFNGSFLPISSIQLILKL